MKVIICGSRTVGKHDDDTPNDAHYSFMFNTLNLAHRERPITLIIEGGAPGADTIARAWAEVNDVPVAEFVAEWSLLGRKAGPIRNRLMAAQPDVTWCIAFTDKPLERSRSTNSMLNEAARKGIPTHLFRVDLETKEF